MDATLLPYLITPPICAGIGWFTNYLAIKMLFHPREPVSLGIVALHGIFPKRKAALAENLGEMIERDLLSHDDIQRALSDPRFHDAFHGILAEHVDTFVDQKIATLNPMIKMFLNAEMSAKIKKLLNDELDSALPDILARAGNELEEHLVVRDVIRQKVESFSMDRIEDILFSILKKEFRFIEFVGGVLGFLIGLVQAGVFYAFTSGAATG